MPTWISNWSTKFNTLWGYLTYHYGIYSIVHRKHKVHAKTLMKNVTKKDLTIFLHFDIETGFKYILFKRTSISSTIPVKSLISLMKLLNMLTCNPLKPGKYFKTILNDVFYYGPCEYFPLIFFNCIMNSKNVLIFWKGYVWKAWKRNVIELFKF